MQLVITRPNVGKLDHRFFVGIGREAAASSEQTSTRNRQSTKRGLLSLPRTPWCSLFNEENIGRLRLIVIFIRHT